MLDYTDPSSGVIDLKLPSGIKKHIRYLHMSEIIMLPDRGLDITDDAELVISTMGFLMESIYMDMLKTLHVADKVSLSKLAVLMKRPYSYVYTAAGDLRMLKFIKWEGGAGRQGATVTLLVKVIPRSEQTKHEIKHPEEYIIECKKRLPKEEKTERLFGEQIKARSKTLEGGTIQDVKKVTKG